MAQVSIENVSKAFGAIPVIHGVSVDIEDGEFVVLVGPSGCGKSTLLRMIAGLEEISGGSVRIGQAVVNDVAPMDRDIAMVFQNYALYPHLSVADNMSFSLRLKGVSKSDRIERVRAASKMLGLDNLLDRYPRQLSGGQRQRVAMGRAIVRQPQVFLFDEPLSNLDAKLRVQMRTEIKELHQRVKTTMIYVTHDQVEAMTMADKIVVLRDGVVEQVGSPLELYDHPANQFVASFIGSPSMNFIEGTVVQKESRYFVDKSGWNFPMAALPQSAVGAQIVFGVRPEHLRVVPRDTPHAMKAQVAVVEPTGAEIVIVFRMGGVDLTASFRERHTFSVGDEVWLLPDAPRSHLFDASKGRRLAADHPIN